MINSHNPTMALFSFSKDTKEKLATLTIDPNNSHNVFSRPESNAIGASTTKMLPSHHPTRDLGCNPQVPSCQAACRPNNASAIPQSNLPKARRSMKQREQTLAIARTCKHLHVKSIRVHFGCNVFKFNWTSSRIASSPLY